MSTITLQEAQSHLVELVYSLAPGEEIVITENNEPVAKLASLAKVQRWHCRAGSAKGKIRIASDFDEPPEQFWEYTE
jgi:prevent-host-death family protein